MKKIFVGNLPVNATDDSVANLFSQFGTVRSVNIVRDIFTGSCKGFGFIEMEGHEARLAIKNLDKKIYEGKPLRVKFEDIQKSRKRSR